MKSPTERLQIAIEALPKRTAPYAVLRIGMDDFAYVNDTYGTPLGSRLLEVAGQRLAAAVREHEAVIRFPGDEFIVLLHSVRSAIRAGAAADRLQELLAREYLLDGESVHLSACIGIAVAPEDGTAADTLVQRAGAALTCAKAAGAGTVQLFEPAMEMGQKKHHSLSLDIRKAVLLGQFAMHYQPQVDAHTGDLLGFEALLRWVHPDLGLVEPAEFLPLADDLGLLPTLGEFVLRTACEQAKQLPEPFTVSVNAATAQFKGGFFADAVQAALFRSGLPAERLEIEVAEATLLEQEALVSAALHELRKLGVHLAMDGFGCGLTSLGHLARLPFRRVKLDRALVGSSPRKRAMVRAITTLSRGVGLTPMALGIETASELAQAQADGVTAVQGFVYSKPLPASAIPSFVEQWQGVSAHRRGPALLQLAADAEVNVLPALLNELPARSFLSPGAGA